MDEATGIRAVLARMRTLDRMAKLATCKHENTRNIYGDEIIWRMSCWRGIIRRQVCLDCGKALNRGLKKDG